jgi:hypothetical protein
MTTAEFRTDRARRIAGQSGAAADVIQRYLERLNGLNARQVETIRRALPPLRHEDGGA